jgi:hypothetical protein
MQIAIGIRINTMALVGEPVVADPPGNDLLMAMNLAAPGSVLPMPNATINDDELALLLDSYFWEP